MKHHCVCTSLLLRFGDLYHVRDLVDFAIGSRVVRLHSHIADLLQAQAAYTAELDALKREGKTRSVRFRELMGKKLQNADILIRLKYYGLE